MNNNYVFSLIGPASFLSILDYYEGVPAAYKKVCSYIRKCRYLQEILYNPCAKNATLVHVLQNYRQSACSSGFRKFQILLVRPCYFFWDKVCRPHSFLIRWSLTWVMQIELDLVEWWRNLIVMTGKLAVFIPCLYLSIYLTTYCYIILNFSSIIYLIYYEM